MLENSLIQLEGLHFSTYFKMDDGSHFILTKSTRSLTTNCCSLVSFAGITFSFQTTNKELKYGRPETLSVQDSTPRGSILHTLFNLTLFITAAQHREQKGKDFFLLILKIGSQWLWKETSGEKIRTGWMSGKICTIYLLYILYLNIILLFM